MDTTLFLGRVSSPESVFHFHCFLGNCPDRGENPADRHAFRNGSASGGGHQLCLFKVGTPGNNAPLCKVQSAE